MATAPQACTTCHDNLAAAAAGEPRGRLAQGARQHRAGATRRRARTVIAKPFCINCHERRDTIQTLVHERNFRFFHSVEARANPMQCGSCHREDFCINCHQQGKVGNLP